MSLVETLYAYYFLLLLYFSRLRGYLILRKFNET